MNSIELEGRATVSDNLASGEESWPWPDSLDALVAAPEYHHVLLENERVRVLDVRISKGHTVPVHTHHWPAVLILVSDGEYIRRDADGAVLFDTRATEKKSVLLVPTWSEPFPPHSVENVGRTEIHVISIEVRNSR